MIRCSVGIMAYNEEQNIARLLAAVQNQELEKVSIENITVVSSGCTDNTENIVREFAQKDDRIKLIVQPRREGKSSAINLWLKDAREEILVLESGDTIPEPHTIEELVLPFQEETIGMTGSHPVPVNNPKTFMGFAVHRLWQLHHLIALKTPKVGEMVAFRNVVRQIPTDSAVDEDSIEAEIHRQGYRTVYCPRAIVQNKGPENFQDFIRQRRRIYAGHLWLQQKFDHQVSTMSGFKALKYMLNDFHWNFYHLVYTPGVILMEVWGRLLGWYDLRIKKKNPHIWEISPTTKLLEDRKNAPKSRKDKIVMALLGIIMAVSLFLRFYHLELRPNWHGDEGANLIMAWNLIHWRAEYLAVNYNFVPHFPLFYFLAGFFTLIFGKTILALRIFTAFCAVGTNLVIYFIGKETKNRWTGLLAAAIFTIIFDVVLNSRYAFYAGLGALEITLLILFIIKYLNTGNQKWLSLSAFAAAVTILTESYYWGILLIFPFILWRRKKLLLRTMAIPFIAFLLFISLMAVLRGKLFVDDFRYYLILRPLSWIASSQETGQNPIWHIISIYLAWLFSYILNITGIIGLFLIKKKLNRKVLLLAFLLVSIPLFFSNQESYLLRNKLLIYPFVAVGAAVFLQHLYRILKDYFSQSLFQKLVFLSVTSIFCFIIFSKNIIKDISFFQEPIDAETKHYQEVDIESIKSVAGYVNERTQPQDYVIAQDELYQFIRARMSNLVQAAAYEGTDSDIYSPEHQNKKTFLFDPSTSGAKYFISNSYTLRLWIDLIPNMKAVIARMEKWPIVFQSGDWIVRQNPEL